MAPAITLLLAAAALLVSSADVIQSQSVDLAHHYALVVRLTQDWVLQNAADPSLGEMNFYPRLAHQFAAVLARLVGSPLLGLHLTSLLAIFVCWASLAAMLLSLPRRAAIGSALAFALLLALNRHSLHLDLHGAEVVSNYFFAQLVAQAFVLAMVALALRLEQAAAAAWQRHAGLGLAVYVAASIHLLPALMLLLVFLGLVGLELLRLARHSSPRPWPTMAVHVLLVILTCLALARHPTLAVMRDISGANGHVIAGFMPGINQFLLYALLLLASSAALLRHWWRCAAQHTGQGGGALALKYLALYGLAAAGLCLLQVLALWLGHGSEYAVHKYLFALNTLLVLQLALWLSLPRSAPPLRPEPARHVLLWPLLTIVAWYGVLPGKTGLDTSALLRLEQQVMARQDLLMPDQPGRYNHVQNLGQFPPMVDYMLTIGLLQTPRAVTRFSQPDSDSLNWRIVGSLVTGAGSALDRHAACRRAPPSGGLAVLDGACLGRALGLRHIIGFTSLHPAHPCVATGLSVAEAFGTWTASKTVTLRCPLPPPDELRPRRLEIEASAFLHRVPAQTVHIGVLGQPLKSYVFDSNKPTQSMALELPEGLASEVQIELHLPNATAPSQLGLGADARVLGLSLRSLEFK